LDDLKSLLPTNPFDRTEKEIVADFDSRIDYPQLVFLGLDEKVKDGYSYKNFTGAPHWAVDITPKKTFEKEANELTEKFVADGFKFSEGMRAMSFPADVGEWGHISLDDFLIERLIRLQPPNMPKAGTTWTGIPATPFVAPAGTRPSPSMAGQNESVRR
jgi:hypothetical protein